MDAGKLVGAALVAGMVIFLVGAGGWRPVYDRPMAESLPAVHADRRRRAWIHTWMVAALLVTPAGLVGLVVLAETALARVVAGMGAAVYMVGAVCWVVSLAFRLTVVPWGAERTVADGAPPEQFVALDAWAASLYTIHMLSAYASFVLLGVAVLAGGDLPAWLGWLGVGWGVAFVAGFVVVADRFAGPFYPPFWAHAYTGVLGVVLLVT
jgi:hypothetical protein